VSTVDSIKARLRNRAQKENRTYQEILTVYGLERALYRLSISSYSSQFVLKGGILLYALYQGDFSRGTADVDLLGQHISNDVEIIKNAFLEVFRMDYPDDGVVFDTSTLKADRITEFKKYAGINISIDGYLDRTKLPVSIDIGFGDVIYPNQVEMEYPTLLDHQAPMIQAYSIDSVIAEKFEAIVSLGKANSRMKDFYDIYALSGSFDFQAETLQEALKETFTNRKTGFEPIVAFEPGFTSDAYRKGMWTSFLKAKKILMSQEFDHVVMNIMSFLIPIIDAIKTNLQFRGTWDHTHKVWITM
jgi:predicted nucleotidyltransferase component of viral defense system